MQRTSRNVDVNPDCRPRRLRPGGRAFLALAILTAVETVRQPVVLLLTIACVVSTALTPLLALHGFGEEGKLARDGGLAFHLTFGLFAAGYGASSALTRELRGGTASMALSKPIGRDAFYLAKLLGILGVVLVFSLCATAATLLADRIAERFVDTPSWVGYGSDTATGWRLLAAPAVALLLAAGLNYGARRPFVSVAYGLLVVSVLSAFFLSGFFDRGGRFAPLDFRVDLRLLPASVLVTLALGVFASLALAVATRLDTTPTLLLCSAVLMAGLAGDYLMDRWNGSGPFHLLIRSLVPNAQHFWLADALDQGGTIPWRYVGQAALYAATWASAVACAGLASFRGVDMR